MSSEFQHMTTCPEDDIGALVVATATSVMSLHGAVGSKIARTAITDWIVPADAWTDIEQAGFPLAMLPEEHGGIGSGHAFAIARSAGAHALAAPLVETMAANWLLHHAGLETVVGAATFSDVPLSATPAAEGWRISGALAGVPWASACQNLICLGRDGAGMRLFKIARECFEVSRHTNLADEPRELCSIDAIVGDDRSASLPAGIGSREVRGLGAALRSMQIAGALSAIVEMTAQYARERRQFGRPIAAFQAVQQMLALMATHAAAAGAAADIGAEAVATDLDVQGIAVAKSRAGEAAGVVAALSHQVHGAIGFTQEYPLQLLTRRLLSWRDEFGGEAEWSIMLGERLTARGGALWPQLTSI